MKFYGIATNNNNQNVVIDNLPTNYIGAVNAAKQLATKKGLTFQYVKPAENGRKEGSVLTKFKKQRTQRKSNKR
ncbi:hypothetical protein NST33_17795 [Paenibacillus sp. FSL L8-0435]|uniref:hypothetical protein n=1 Tax=Paenibacillus sp. FSL L8-0435 TaxID=2954618 RepID=UPI0030DB8E80